MEAAIRLPLQKSIVKGLLLAEATLSPGGCREETGESRREAQGVETRERMRLNEQRLVERRESLTSTGTLICEGTADRGLLA
jgi:hypothetical protein